MDYYVLVKCLRTVKTQYNDVLILNIGLKKGFTIHSRHVRSSKKKITFIGFL